MMKLSSAKRKYLIVSFIILAFSICFNIISNRVKTYSLKADKPFVITIDENLPPGEYFLEYYVACSNAKRYSPSMEFSLKTIDASGIEILYDKLTYSSAIGFGKSEFKIKNSGDTVIAEFKKPGSAEVFSNFTISARLGAVHVVSKDSSYRKAVYNPVGIGKQAKNIQLPTVLTADLELADFATLKKYSLNGKTLELTFFCTKETSKKYEIGMKISSDNINALLPNGVRHSFYTFTADTDTWVAGEEYVQNIYLGLIPGGYHLELDLTEISPKTPRYISNYLLMDNKNLKSIGSIDIHGQSLSDFLRSIEDGQIVLLSVMDEAAGTINEISLHSLHNLGLQSDLNGKYRWSYMGIAAKDIDGFTPMEQLDQSLIEVNLPTGSLLGSYSLPFDLQIISAGFDVGNTSSILINQNEYSLKGRGLNIVVYDIFKNEVVSAINFDTHATNYN